MDVFKKAVASATALILALCMTSASSFAEAGIDAEPEQPIATLMFASDYQSESEGVSPQGILMEAASAAKKAKPGRSIDSLIMCGDYTNIKGQSNYNGDTAKAAASSKEIRLFSRLVDRKTKIHFLQGNHDAFDESFMDPTGAKEYQNYILYIMNTEDANPWQQGAAGAEQTVKNAAAELEAYLNKLIDNKDGRPVIIATHVPLHFSGRTGSIYRGGVGDNMYSSYFFDVINEAAKELNIFFVFGHNHSNGWDSYIGGGSVYKRPGDTLLIPDCKSGGICTDVYTEETLNFTYMNAGYVGHFSNYPQAADTDFTVSVMEIYEDSIVVERYSPQGLHCLSAAGVHNNYYDDSELIKDSYLSAEIQGPDTIDRIKPAKVTIIGDLNGDGYVDSDDAIFLMNHVNDPDNYKIDQECDFKKDGQIDSGDAVYLLYHTLLPDRFPIN